MAGRVRHMERSHRSHRKSDNFFTPFVRHAYGVKEAKRSRETFGQMLARAFSPLKTAMKHAASK